MLICLPTQTDLYADCDFLTFCFRNKGITPSPISLPGASSRGGCRHSIDSYGDRTHHFRLTIVLSRFRYARFTSLCVCIQPGSLSDGSLYRKGQLSLITVLFDHRSSEHWYVFRGRLSVASWVWIYISCYRIASGVEGTQELNLSCPWHTQFHLGWFRITIGVSRVFSYPANIVWLSETSWVTLF